MPEPASVRLPDPATLILTIRRQRVLLDSDIATLYGVETKALNRAVKRNIERFPEDFMFQLTVEEHEALRFQSGASKEGRGGRRYLPYVFTQEGVAMLSSVLQSPRAVSVNIAIMRAFIRLRAMALSVDELACKVDALEKKYDGQFRVIFDALRQLVAPPPEKEKPRIGFHPAN
jgi:hypothetical protein